MNEAMVDDENPVLTVGELSLSTGQVSPKTTVTEVYDLLSANPGVEALAVVDGETPVALITRTKLLFILSRRFGYELHARHPITVVADTAPLRVLESELLDSVIERACARQVQDVYDEIIVTTESGRYLGLLSLKELIIQQSIALTRSVLLQEVATARNLELEKINQVKSHFLANVTHELRSPVNAIIGLVQILKTAADNSSIEQVQERLTFLMSTAANLRSIVTNILDLSKLEAGKMEVAIKEVDVMPVLREVVETTRLLLGNKPVAVNLVAPVQQLTMDTDAIKLRQILINLAGNAAKFTDRGIIEIGVAVEAAGVDISVSDTGIGIREEDLPVLFTVFGQIEDATTKSREGTGLGLAISSNLAKLIGAVISVKSSYGEGSVFTLSLSRHITA